MHAAIRPRKQARPVAVRRTCAKLIRFSPDELARVVERARAVRQPPARYIREAALGGAPRSRAAPVADDVVRRLARLGVILRDLAPTVHHCDAERGAVFDAALADLLDVIRAAD